MWGFPCCRQVSGTNSFVCLALYEKCNPDTELYDGRLGQGCVLWDPINAHSMRAAIYDAYTNGYELVTDFHR